MRPSDCVVLVPYARVIEPRCQECLLALANRGYPVRVLPGCSLVDLARGTLATNAYDEGFAETLWVDSDIVFSVADVERLREHNRPFTAGIYPKKGPKEFAATFAQSGTYCFGAKGSLLEVRYAGMGFTHVRREVYEAIEKSGLVPRCDSVFEAGRTMVPYFLPMTVREGTRTKYLGEDMAFCHRARACGFAPCVDTRLKLGHIGPHAYTWDDFGRTAFASLEFSVEVPPVPEEKRE